MVTAALGTTPKDLREHVGRYLGTYKECPRTYLLPIASLYLDPILCFVHGMGLGLSDPRIDPALP